MTSAKRAIGSLLLAVILLTSWGMTRRTEPLAIGSPLATDPLCVAERGPVLVAGACEDAGSWYWWAAARARRGAGRRICWWSADQAAFVSIRGVGAATAERLVAYRDRYGMPDIAGLRSIRGIGASTAQIVRSAVELRCARRAVKPANTRSASVAGRGGAEGDVR